jgi:hypothetical protein
MREEGIAAKTANRYREALSRLSSKAVAQRGIRMPGGRNPAAKVERQQESAETVNGDNGL